MSYKKNKPFGFTIFTRDMMCDLYSPYFGAMCDVECIDTKFMFIKFYLN